MERESFENEEIAEIMNQNFVNIKVDREERPDVDKIYMTYVQSTTGGGGWPMSVWLTTELKPFLGGTYYPPYSQWGRPGFAEILTKIAGLWKNKRAQLLASGDQVIDAIKEHVERDILSEKARDRLMLDNDVFKKYYDQIDRSFDSKLGGFSKAPKFPRPVIFTALYSLYAKTRDDKILQMCELTLRKMAEGGMNDHIGGGFHRYSVTKDWHVPHFEKMLYDQAQLALAYVTAYQITGHNMYAGVTQDILDYVEQKLRAPQGGFYSAEDADSLAAHNGHEKSEGAFYVWEHKEILQLLGEDAALFCELYNVREDGNVEESADPHHEFTRKNILERQLSYIEVAKNFNITVEEARQKIDRSKDILFKEREKRPKPFLDDKIITAWNGLMISAFTIASRILKSDHYLNTAKQAATFIKNVLYKNGALIRSFRDGPSNVPAFADDYAFLITALLDLYEATAEAEWLEWAIDLQKKMDKLFWDDKGGAYFSVDGNDDTLVLRLKEDYDGAEPSYNSFAAFNLARLSHMTNNSTWDKMARQTFNSFEAQLSKAPIVLPHMVAALNFYITSPKQIVIAGDPKAEDTKRILNMIHSKFMPNRVILYADNDKSQKLLQKHGVDVIQDGDMRIDGKATAYICQNFTCKVPANELHQIEKMLDEK
jgi:hypothetical protein